MTQENNIDCDLANRAVVLLERIAVALEKLAATSQLSADKVPSRTAFPWDRVSVRCRRHLRRAVEYDRDDMFLGRKWPLSCEDLMEIGFDHLVNEMPIRNWSKKSAEEIVPVMAELGFADWRAT